jgi:hypothetical protein
MLQTWQDAVAQVCWHRHRMMDVSRSGADQGPACCRFDRSLLFNLVVIPIKRGSSNLDLDASINSRVVDGSNGK